MVDLRGEIALSEAGIFDDRSVKTALEIAPKYGLEIQGHSRDPVFQAKVAICLHKNAIERSRTVRVGKKIPVYTRLIPSARYITRYERWLVLGRPGSIKDLVNETLALKRMMEFEDIEARSFINHFLDRMTRVNSVKRLA